MEPNRSTREIVRRLARSASTAIFRSWIFGQCLYGRLAVGCLLKSEAGTFNGVAPGL